MPSPEAEPIGTTAGHSRAAIARSTRSSPAPARSILFTNSKDGPVQDAQHPFYLFWRRR